MTAAPGSGKKGLGFTEGLDSMYDPYPWFMIGDEIENHIPWPEWSDHELNGEVWDETKVKLNIESEVKISVPSPSVFEDPNPPMLPISLEEHVHQWKRPQDVFPGVTLMVFDPSNADFKLSVPSKIVNYDFFWHVMEILPLLQYYAREHGFSVEWESSHFVSSTQGEMWRPWHHVYALCKAGKGQVHKPLYHTFGKYILRLYYMGTWRRFVVDDKIPCDKQGKCMLPVTQTAGELWPVLLVKALLKVVSLTRAKSYAIIDFPIITFFTGWMKESQNIFKKTTEQVWRRFSAFLPEYELPEKESEPKNPGKDTSEKKDSSKNLTKKNNALPSRDFCFILAVVDGMSGVDRPHVIVVVMTRVIPMVKANRKAKTTAWKKIRWIYWASKKGMWADESKLPPYRRLEYITFVKDLNKFIVPDPKDEAAVFDIPVEEENGSVDHASSTGHKSYEPRQWSDFYKVAKYLSALVVYFKPSCFPFGFKVSCMKKDAVKKSVDPLGTNRRNSHFESPKIKPSGNQPPIVFCEAPVGIYLLISLSVCPTSFRRMTGYLDETLPEVLTVVKATLTVERFDWRNSQQGEIIGMGKTVGHSSFSLNLRPGRHILKLWISTDCPFVVHLHSNAEIFVGRDLSIRSLMIGESEIIMSYINNLSAAFINLVQSFGKPEIRSALRSFYQAIEPGNRLMIGYRTKLDEFIETFLNSILVCLKPLIPNLDEFRITQGALQSLFVNPKIVCDLPGGLPPLSIYASQKKSVKIPYSTTRLKTLSEILLFDWCPEHVKLLIKIQKVFRGRRVRLLLERQKPTCVEFKPYAERLKKVCELMFSPARREEEVGQCLRVLIVSNPGLLETFRFHEDFSKVNQIDVFTGKVNNVENWMWVPITRFIIASHNDDCMPCCFYFSCNLEQFIVQAINNDTCEELFRLSNIVAPHYFEKNIRGYTIFIYGWNESGVKGVNWRLEMVRMKYFNEPHFCNKLIDSYCHPYAMPNFRTVEIRNFYVPNHKSRICRCLIKIQKRCLLSLRLSVTNPDARFTATISLNKNYCMSNAETVEHKDKLIVTKESLKGAILLPAVILEYFDPIPMWANDTTSEFESCTLYILEALVLDNSWPLTKQEWGTVEPIRVNGENWNDSSTSFLSKKNGTESRKKSSRTFKKFSTDSRALENPSWSLQVVVDVPEKSDPTDLIVIEEDKSYSESVKAMKVYWEENNPGRRQTGREARLDFLRAMYSLGAGSAMPVAGGEEEDLDRESDGFSLMMNRLSRFSYLTQDESIERFSKSPRQFPKMPTQELLDAYKKQSHLVGTESFGDDATDIWHNAAMISSIGSIISRNQRSEFFNNHIRWRILLEDHLSQQQQMSKQLMEQSYERRQKMIERLTR